MSTEEIRFEQGGRWWKILLVESESKTTPWKVWYGNKFLAGGTTRDEAIWATRATINNWISREHRI